MRKKSGDLCAVQISNKVCGIVVVKSVTYRPWVAGLRAMKGGVDLAYVHDLVGGKPRGRLWCIPCSCLVHLRQDHLDQLTEGERFAILGEPESFGSFVVAAMRNIIREMDEIGKPT